MKPPGRPRTGFTVIEHGAADIILAAAFNHSGTRITLCSADHKIRVYDLDEEKRWSLVDQWRGHDAEVLDVGSSHSFFFLPAQVIYQGSMGWTDPRTAFRYHWW